ncbi:methyltransferase [Bacillus rubiinfantis]|uniref:methyltransferase n=1 Tax=Bacillus rubiinfantis TaxID=1499680 RepID=UPI0005A78F46|nr:methyltransferase [Bacillus rubiinfantis]
MKEHYFDKLLNIDTGSIRLEGPQQKPLRYYPYEPTPYHALEELFAHYELTPMDRVVDFGCGKGRLNFYIHYFFHASVVGIEMNQTLYAAALENAVKYGKKTKNRLEKIHFRCCLAEEYQIHYDDNRFYFFNPFSVHIFRSTVQNMMQSAEERAREIEIILYYPSEDYIYYLQNETPFQLKQEIILPHDYTRDQRERFLIYRLL